MLPILLGLTGALCWGIADFAARYASRRIGAYRTLLYMQLFGFLALSIYLRFHGGFSAVAPGWRPWALAVVAGLFNMLGSLALYRSFEIGVMSVVAPVSSSYPALTVLLSLLTGERLQPMKAAGLAVTFLGVLLAATSFGSASTASAKSPAGSKAPGPKAHATHLTAGVPWAILGGAMFGVLFWFLGYYVVPATGSMVSVWVIRLTSFSTLVLFAAPARQTLRIPHGSVWWLLAAVGVMDTAAFIANNAGLGTGQISTVTVLASLYGAVTVFLSWIFLREQLEWSQWLGIALIFVGIVQVTR
jgi:drug/metabolite transporter (DMT)-like permease